MLCCAVWCCVLLCCVVLCCTVLCCFALCCVVLYCVVLCCAVLYCVELCCAVLCCIVLCCVVLYCIVLCCVVLCCVVLCCLYHFILSFLMLSHSSRHHVRNSVGLLYNPESLPFAPLPFTLTHHYSSLQLVLLPSPLNIPNRTFYLLNRKNLKRINKIYPRKI